MIALVLYVLTVLAPVSEGSVRTDLNDLERILRRVDIQFIAVGKIVGKSCVSCDDSCPDCIRRIVMREFSKDLDELMGSFKTIRDNIDSCRDGPKSVIWNSNNRQDISVEDSTGTVTSINQAAVLKVDYDDAVGRIIYSVASGSVYSSLPDGSDPMVLDDRGVYIFGIAVISANKYMFGSGNLYKYDNGVTTVINSVFSAQFFRLSFNPTDGYVYFTTSFFVTAIFRVDCDGNIDRVHQTNPDRVGLSGIAVDVSAQEVYYTEYNPPTLSKYNLETGVETFVMDLRATVQDIYIEGDSLFIAYNGIGVIEEWSLVSRSTVRNLPNAPTSRPTVAAWLE